MKNYVVKASMEFDDYEGLEIKPENPRTKRKIGDVFNVTKERYEYLEGRGLVTLVGIDKLPSLDKKATKKKK